ncbi:MAG: YafY family protein [Burkholderiales bacterium]|nr:YafY family protein [Burkholderiales bacterium]
MRRADRLFAIIQALRGGRLRTAGWLAQQLEVSTRTIYRDIADLQANSAPIDGERGVGYLLRDEFFLPPLALTTLEAEALQWGVALVAAHGDEALARAASELLAKLRVERAPFHAPPSLTRAQRLSLKTVREALAQSKRLRIAYRDHAEVTTERTLRPLSLEHWGKVWTLTAWCELRADFRVFRVDRIIDCEPAGSFRPERGKQSGDYLASLRSPEKG